MTKGILNLQMMGRFGNQAMQYLAARAIAERDNLELRTPRWIGEKIFAGVPATAEPDYSGDYLHGYFQNQASAIYTLTQVREWFRFKPEIERELNPLRGMPCVAHMRRGDMAGYGYPLVALQSYYNACHKFDLFDPCFLTEESPTIIALLPPDICFVADFYVMSTALTLLRANSTFSFVASMLNPNRVLSPVIDGLEGGKEHLCEFVEGNWPKLCNLEGFTDLHIKP